MSEETKQQILRILNDEASRIDWGKVLIEATVAKGKVTNIQFETRRSLNVNT